MHDYRAKLFMASDIGTTEMSLETRVGVARREGAIAS